MPRLTRAERLLRTYERIGWTRAQNSLSMIPPDGVGRVAISDILDGRLPRKGDLDRVAAVRVEEEDGA